MHISANDLEFALHLLAMQAALMVLAIAAQRCATALKIVPTEQMSFPVSELRRIQTLSNCSNI